jgi:hypothetical protein
VTIVRYTFLILFLKEIEDAPRQKRRSSRRRLHSSRHYPWRRR